MPDARPILTYFVFRGLGEPIRLMLEDLGVAYEDRRLEFADWGPVQPETAFGQLPRLQIEGRTLFQSQAILRHLARTHGLMPQTEDEQIRCDMGAEAARDVQMRLWDYFWMAGSNTEAAAREFADGQLAGLLANYSRWFGDAPYIGGERPLFPDYYAVTVLDEAGDFFPAAMAREPSLAAYRQRMHERPGIAAYIASGRQSDFYGFDPHRGLRGPKGNRAP
ncbi:MAG TPA: glutathione S-transferase family protein [Caulobacteraceae bacterium]|jgi:glutathione S-transferase|nr:glutathione S-transferase family protein [Caulobacteraceae bacterium]